MMTRFNPAPDRKLPDEVIRLLKDAAVGGRQAVYQLLTVGDEGWPHAALSSARQWWVGDERVACVILAGRTSRYLSEHPQALLFVVGARRAYSIRLSCTVIEDAGEGRVVVAFDVIAADSDTRDVALTPMQFEASDELTRLEQASQNAAALAAQLAGQRPDPRRADS
jgi:hypothetical protein